jgi:hypothetical protein
MKFDKPAVRLVLLEEGFGLLQASGLPSTQELVSCTNDNNCPILIFNPADGFDSPPGDYFLVLECSNSPGVTSAGLSNTELCAVQDQGNGTFEVNCCSESDDLRDIIESCTGTVTVKIADNTISHSTNVFSFPDNCS